MVFRKFPGLMGILFMNLSGLWVVLYDLNGTIPYLGNSSDIGEGRIIYYEDFKMALYKTNQVAKLTKSGKKKQSVFQSSLDKKTMIYANTSFNSGHIQIDFYLT